MKFYLTLAKIGIISAAILFGTAYADQNIVNQCNPNVTTDPRVPPAGTYTIQNGNGSSTQVYSTGETKPYIVDNNCGSNATTTVQPIIQPGGRFRR